MAATNKYINLPSGARIFYREAGSPSAPVVLLLHGFPSSSHQFRRLIPLLSPHYHVVAPDLPGFGFTSVPASFTYSFASIASTIGSFLDALSISKFAVYIFDYGAPTGLRLALERPDSITAIITQNGNAYEAGLGDFWAPVKAYWQTTPGSDEYVQIRDALRGAALTLTHLREEYESGEPASHLPNIGPATYHLDAALLERDGNKEIQLDLFKDYEDNVKLYPQFHEYFRKSQVPLLAAWGKNDFIFIAPGAEAFKQDLPNAEVHLLDAGHFAVESHTEEIGELILKFLKKNGI